MTKSNPTPLAQNERILNLRRISFRFDDVYSLSPLEKNRLEELLSLSMKLNLEVVPGLLDSPTKDWINSVIKLQLVETHQHGYAHTNHEVKAKKSEFGPNRNYKEKFQDMLQGMEIMKKFGDSFCKIFCPPWNRMDYETEQICEALKFKGISCFKDYVTQSKILKNFSATIAWPDSIEEAEVGLNSVVTQLTSIAQTNREANIMLHLKNMTEHSFQLLKSLILLAKQDGISSVLYSEIINE